MGEFSKKTKQGYKILEKYEDAIYGLPVVVVKRDNDYAVGFNYNEDDGQWQQGHYDFESKENAIQYIKDRYMNKVRANIQPYHKKVKTSITLFVNGKEYDVVPFDRGYLFSTNSDGKRWMGDTPNEIVGFIYEKDFNKGDKVSEDWNWEALNSDVWSAWSNDMWDKIDQEGQDSHWDSDQVIDHYKNSNQPMAYKDNSDSF